MTGLVAFVTDLVFTAIVVPALIVGLACIIYRERGQK